MRAIPVLCFTCGAPFGDRYLEYIELRRQNKTHVEIIEILNLDPQKYCCLALFQSTIPASNVSVSMEPPKGSKFSFRSQELYDESLLQQQQESESSQQKPDDSNDADICAEDSDAEYIEYI